MPAKKPVVEEPNIEAIRKHWELTIRGSCHSAEYRVKDPLPAAFSSAPPSTARTLLGDITQIPSLFKSEAEIED